MLVHFKDPLGNIVLHGQRIYGNATGFPPADIPFPIFQRYCSRRDKFRQKDNVLIQATYRASDLKKMLGKDFSSVAFKYDELPSLPNITLKRLWKEMGIVPKHELDIDGNPTDRKHLLELIKRQIREASPKC